MTTPPSTGPTAKPIGPDAPKTAMTVADPAARHGVADRPEHDPGVAELEADEEHAQGELPRLAAEGDRGEHDGLDERAPDDDRLAAVLVGPHAPERHERHADDEDEGAEEADEPEPVGLGHAHRLEVLGQEGEDLADARCPRRAR